MSKHFNTTGTCYPNEHYMINMEKRLDEIERLVARGEYFTINRARQYGKTTLLSLLSERLSGRYCVFPISFEGMSDDVYETETSFGQRLCGLLHNSLTYQETRGISESSQTECGKMMISKI